MIKHLVTVRGDTVLSNAQNKCLQCIGSCNSESQVVSNCKLGSGKRRQGKRTTEDGFIYLCSEDKDIVNSNRVFKEKLNVYSEVLSELKNAKADISNKINSETKRLIHNLTSLNGHNIQEVFDLVPQEKVAQNMRHQVELINSHLKDNFSDVAPAILRIAKNNMAIKTEFSVFNKLYETEPRLNKKFHAIHKVLLNILSLFFQELVDSEINVVIEPCEETVFLDYESIHVALYHLIGNAVKYIHKDTVMVIGWHNRLESFVMSFDMISLRIEEEEMDSLFEEGYSGINAVNTKKAGDGIGMFRIAKILQLNGASLSIKRDINYKNRRVTDGVPYDNNIFEISF
jgi:signal transduction histidine kinase